MTLQAAEGFQERGVRIFSVTSASSDVNLIGADVPSARQQAN